MAAFPVGVEMSCAFMLPPAAAVEHTKDSLAARAIRRMAGVQEEGARLLLEKETPMEANMQPLRRYW